MKLNLNKYDFEQKRKENGPTTQDCEGKSHSNSCTKRLKNNWFKLEQTQGPEGRTVAKKTDAIKNRKEIKG